LFWGELRKDLDTCWELEEESEDSHCSDI